MLILGIGCTLAALSVAVVILSVVKKARLHARMNTNAMTAIQQKTARSMSDDG